MISGLDDKAYANVTLESLEDDKFKEKIVEFLKVADLGIHDIQKGNETSITVGNMPEDIPEKLKKVFELMLSNDNLDTKIEQFNLFSLHKKLNEKGDFEAYEKFDFGRNESQGTQKIFSLAGPLLDTLEKGKILVIDELEARLHPLITRFITSLFHNNMANPNNAQLVFATHDAQLLNREYFRRDQLWFTEKDEFSSTDLYSLAEYKESSKKIRKDASYMKDYILGKYGAIPFIGSIDRILGDVNE
jgi:AAA15 family ATPase/GTPase